MRKKTKKIKKPTLSGGSKHGDIPVLQRELRAVKNQVSSVEISLKHDIQTLDDKLSNKMQSLENKLTRDMQKMIVLMEEQNSRNIAVLDGYGLLHHRQDRLEGEVTKIKKHVGIA